MNKSVQIPVELWVLLIKRYIFDQDVPENELKSLIEAKIDAIARREAYTRSKTAESPSEREEARQRYIDMIGLSDDFRW